jgi:hypothetical protein
MTAVHGDAVGYSQLIAENEIEARNTLQSHRRLIEAAVWVMLLLGFAVVVHQLRRKQRTLEQLPVAA